MPPGKIRRVDLAVELPTADGLRTPHLVPLADVQRQRLAPRGIALGRIAIRNQPRDPVMPAPGHRLGLIIAHPRAPSW